MDQKHAPDEALKEGIKDAVNLNQPRVPVFPL